MARSGKQSMIGGATRNAGSDTTKSVGPSRTTTAMGKSRTGAQGDGMGTTPAKYGNNTSGATALSRGHTGGGGALKSGVSQGSALQGATHTSGRAALQKGSSSKDLGGSTVGGKGW